MKKNSVAYAASFGDSHFEQDDYQKLNEKLKNFNAIGLRENQMIPYVASHVDVPVQRVIDPTLLLTSNEYDKIADERLENEKYLLLYARRYNPHMEAYAEKLAADGIDAKVINIHTIKPLDEELVLKAAKQTGRVYTVEEHSIIGGLGSAVAELLGEKCPTKITRIGVKDVFGESGPAKELLHKYELDAEGIAKRIMEEQKSC